ncbi:hypothetical protein RN001_012522 [Aquatica leii]|uniref:O-acyltransferase n=1 Tax=Aquatica leii TaxID=1421715 RepID=A0AAN7NYJ9_9COLE|nr:hypothetical protein RN001_012522 [Aquatica leii]
MTNTKETTTKKEKSDLIVRAKFFETKDSLLTELYKDEDKAAVAQIGIAAILGYLGYIAISDIFYNAGNKFGYKLIFISFPNVSLLMVSWCTVFISCMIAFSALQIWGRLRLYLSPKCNFISATCLKVLDSLLIVGFVCYWFGVFTFAAYVTSTGYVTNLCAASLLLESFRMFAKTYACVRDTVPKMLKNKLKSEEHQYYPTFSNFLYFMFAPTLVYNDSYPKFVYKFKYIKLTVLTNFRLKTPIRWSFILEWLLHIVVVAITFSCFIDTMMLSELGNLKNLRLMDIFALSFKFHFIVLIYIIFIFYIILHCVQNIFAEILGFPYRVFYKDWWSSKNFVDFFNKWNVLVSDWFYIYVYHDVYRNLTNNNKFLAKYAVFFLSAVFHEACTSLAFGYFLPIVFVEYFMLVVVVSFVKIKSGRWANVFFWFSQSMGISLALVVLILENFARIKCPVENETISTIFTPRIFSCNQ